MNALHDQVQGTILFIKTDLKRGYNPIWITKGDESKTAIGTHYGHLAYLVIPLGFTNAPASFHDIMQEIFQDPIDHGVVIYIEDILIYLSIGDQHVALVREVLPQHQV